MAYRAKSRSIVAGTQEGNVVAFPLSAVRALPLRAAPLPPTSCARAWATQLPGASAAAASDSELESGTEATEAWASAV